MLVEPGNGGLERQLAPGELKSLDEIGGSGEQYTPPVLDEGKTDCGGQVALPTA